MKEINARLSADIVIIGAGTAGCVLAARLSEAPGLRVALLEAGPKDTNPWIDVPFGMQKLISNPSVNWMYDSQPITGANNRSLLEPRGRVIGGTGAIDASLYVRGNPLDFDGWKALGCVGWGYDDILPYFKLAEHQERGADDFHGVGGPMWVTDGPGDALSHILSPRPKKRPFSKPPTSTDVIRKALVDIKHRRDVTDATARLVLT